MKPSFKFGPAIAAAVLFAAAVAFAGSGVPEFSHRVHPLALRGTAGLPQAALFNAGAFVAPGLLMAWAGQRLRRALSDAGWLARIGIVLVQFSALAFAAQGVVPLDPSDSDATASRLHALAWMLWWIALVPGMLLLGVGGRRGAGFAFGCFAAAVAVPLLAMFPPVGLPVGIAERLAFALWFGWWLLAPSLATCTSASAPGSSPTARR